MWLVFTVIAFIAVAILFSLFSSSDSSSGDDREYRNYVENQISQYNSDSSPYKGAPCIRTKENWEALNVHQARRWELIDKANECIGRYGVENPVTIKAQSELDEFNAVEFEDDFVSFETRVVNGRLVI